MRLNKLKLGIQYGAEVTLNLSLNIIGDDDRTFPDKLSLTNTQVSKTRNSFVNGLAANVKIKKTQLSKMVQLVLVVFHINGDNVTYFDSFGIEHIPGEIKNFTLIHMN